MTITAKVIEHSRAPNGKELFTLQLTYPRFIHAEVLTHRDKSRNASSSRAIPVKKMIENTLADPAFFTHIGLNQGGMQAKQEVDAEIRKAFESEWNELAGVVAAYVNRWSTCYNIHKQVANRALEPWQHIHVVMSGTEWANMDELRNHEDAQPEFQVLQQAVIKARAESRPRFLTGDKTGATAWHLPYVTENERQDYWDTPLYLAKISTARAARVSYLTHEGKEPSIDADLTLYERLVGSAPLHASPTEHQGYPLNMPTSRSKNFMGFRQYREVLERQTFVN